MTRSFGFAHFVTVAVLLSSATAQLDVPRQKQFVSMATPSTTEVQAGKTTRVELQFRVDKGKHVNSNKPTSELLIPTKLSLSAPNDIVTGDVTYPPGEEFTLPIAPDEKLSVYGGAFAVSAAVTPARKASPGTYRIHGQLQYQACSDRACFPPQKLPVAFDVKVLRSSSVTHRNPPQSPHAHLP